MIRIVRLVFRHMFQDLHAIRNELRNVRSELRHTRKLIMANNAELQARLEAIDGKLNEAGVEIPALIQQLRDEIANLPSGTTPEIDAILDTVDAKVSALADVVPNAASDPDPTDPDPTFSN